MEEVNQNQKEIMNTTTDLSISAPYAQFLHEAKARIVSAQAHVARSMNIGVIGLYWDLGKLIVEKQILHGWGDSVVRFLAKDLTRELQAGKSFSARNLWFMRQMYLEYSQSEESGKVKQAVSLSIQTKVKQLVSQIPWGQNIAILQKVKTFDARVWYLEATARYGWSRNILLNQIKTDAYSRNVLEKKSHNFHSVLPPKLADGAISFLNLDMVFASSAVSIGWYSMPNLITLVKCPSTSHKGLVTPEAICSPENALLRMVKAKLRGIDNYFSLPGNSKRRHEVDLLFRRTLNRWLNCRTRIQKFLRNPNRKSYILTHTDYLLTHADEGLGAMI